MNKRPRIARISLTILLLLTASALAMVLASGTIFLETYQSKTAYAKTVPPAPSTTQPQKNTLDPTIIVQIIASIGLIFVAIITGIFSVRAVRVGLQNNKQASTNLPQDSRYMNKSKKFFKGAGNQKPSKRLLESMMLMQIFDMPSALRASDLYVPAKVAQDSASSTFFNYPTSTARDTNTFLKQGQQLLERRFQSAKDIKVALSISSSEGTSPRCLLTGCIGTGKTMHLKHYGIEYACPQLPNKNFRKFRQSINQKINGYRLPLYLELKDFAPAKAKDPELKLVDFIATQWKSNYGFVEANKYIEEKLAKQQAIFLLNGLDEALVGDNPDKVYESVINEIKRLGTNYTDIPIVVTSRDSSYQLHSERGMSLNDGGFSRWELLDFRPEDIDTFITNWSRCQSDFFDQNAVTNLKAQLQQNLRIQSLAANPLLLARTIMLHKQYGDWRLPDQRANFYHNGAKTLLDWDQYHKIHRPLHRLANSYIPLPIPKPHPIFRIFAPNSAPAPVEPDNKEYKLTLLSKIAWCFHKKQTYHLPEDPILQDKEIEDFINTFISGIGQDKPLKPALLLEEIVEDGFLKKHGQEYCFLCLPLQEYFAAKHAKADSKAGKELNTYARDPWWAEVIAIHAKL